MKWKEIEGEKSIEEDEYVVYEKGFFFDKGLNIVENDLFIYDVLYVGYLYLLNKRFIFLIDLDFVWEYCF